MHDPGDGAILVRTAPIRCIIDIRPRRPERNKELVRHVLRHSEEFPPKTECRTGPSQGKLFLCFSMRMIATAILDDAFNFIDRENDDILLVAGGSDRVPVVAKLIERGFKVEVAFGIRRHGNSAKSL